MWSGVSSYSPKALGRPAFGCAETKQSATRDSSATYGRSSSAPSAQFSPTASGRTCRTEFQNASVTWPDRVRPLASVMVPETITGHRRPCSSNRVSTAKIAALALRVSKMVSISRMSAPPSTSPRASSRYAATRSSKLTLRAPGSLTSGEIDAVFEVGPERAGDEARSVGGGDVVDRLAGERRGRDVQLVAEVLEAVVGLRDARAVEGVGADDVGARVEVGAVDLADHVGVAQGQQVVVAGQAPVVRREALAAVRRLVEPVPLDHRAHRAVEHQDPLAEQLRELLGRVGTVCPRWRGHGTPRVGGPSA